MTGLLSPDEVLAELDAQAPAGVAYEWSPSPKNPSKPFAAAVAQRRPCAGDLWRRRDSNAVVRVVDVVAYGDEPSPDRYGVLYELLNPASPTERRVGAATAGTLRRGYWYAGSYEPAQRYRTAFPRVEDAQRAAEERARTEREGRVVARLRKD